MSFLCFLEPSYCQVSSLYSVYMYILYTCAVPTSYKLPECWWLLVRMSLAHFTFQRSVPCSEVSPLCQYNCISLSGCSAHTGFQFSLEILVDQAIVENRGTFLRKKNGISTKLKSDLFSTFTTFNSLLVDSELVIIWRGKGYTCLDIQPCEELPLFSAGIKWVEPEDSNVFENTPKKH